MSIYLCAISYLLAYSFLIGFATTVCPSGLDQLMLSSLTVILSPYDIDERVLNLILNAPTCFVAVDLDAVNVARRAADTAIFLHIINIILFCYIYFLVLVLL